MFRLVQAPLASTSSNPSDSKLMRHTTTIMDDLMDAEIAGNDDDEAMDGTGPTRAQAIGGYGRVTGPGEAIADSGKWMR